MALRCEVCNGRKKVLGMGGMMKVCDECKGTGWFTPVMLCAPSISIDKRSKAYRELKKQQEA